MSSKPADSRRAWPLHSSMQSSRSLQDLLCEKLGQEGLAHLQTIRFPPCVLKCWWPERTHALRADTEARPVLHHHYVLSFGLVAGKQCGLTDWERSDNGMFWNVQECPDVGKQSYCSLLFPTQSVSHCSSGHQLVFISQQQTVNRVRGVRLYYDIYNVFILLCVWSVMKKF